MTSNSVGSGAEGLNTEGQSDRQRSAVDKALDILKTFRNEPSGLGVSKVARLSGLPKTTTHRLLANLAANGALERSGDIYRLGPLIFDLVSSSDNSEKANMVSEVGTPFLAALFEQTRHTVHLAYLDGKDVAYANKLFSTKKVSAPSRIGGRAPSYCTGVGKALLAHNPASAELVLASELAPWTPHTITDPEELRKELIRVRVEGVAYDLQEISMGLSCVAAPIFGQANKAIAALSISSPVESFNPGQLIPPLKRVAAAAGKAIRIAQMNLDAES